MEIITVLIYLAIYLGLFSTAFYILSFLSKRTEETMLFEDNELPKVTVLIPAYNEEKTISKTIKSILKSNYPNFEVLVIDDGSKDDTLKLAKTFESEKVKIYHKENGGKGTALNFGIKRAKGEVIFTMDADTEVDPNSMKRMVRFFKNPRVMSVTPAMVIDNPKSILQRVQYMEYLMGLFLRKTFAILEAIYIAPGAFSAYRKKFFDKHGGYEEGNITEDLEMALRIQYHGYKTENCPEAPAYTTAPAKFKPLLIQRRRWYFGLIKNLIAYKSMISRKYGDLGTFVIPTAILSIFFSIVVTLYLFFKSIFELKKEFLFLQSINFDFSSLTNINFYVIERFLFLFFTKPAVIFILIFMTLLGVYLIYAAKKIGRTYNLFINLQLFFFLFAILFGFWWVVSIIYAIFKKDINWR